jgi:uncharacterized protein (DUF2267 family)
MDLTMADIQDLNAAVPAAEAWIAGLMQRLGWHDRSKAYSAMLATLHALRDCLPQDEAIYLAANLPPLLRGLYYEGWHPGGRAPAANGRSAFLERIHEGVHRELGIDPEQVAHAVFALLAERLPAGELEDAKAATPQALHMFWPS